MNQNTKNMLAGKPYCPNDPELAAWQQSAHQLNRQYNQTAETNTQTRQQIIDQLVPHHGKNVTFVGPIFFDYGRFTTIGDDTYANFNLTVLDTCPVLIGSHCMFGPNVTLVTATHPLLADQRNPHVASDGSVKVAELGAPTLLFSPVSSLAITPSLVPDRSLPTIFPLTLWWLAFLHGFSVS